MVSDATLAVLVDPPSVSLNNEDVIYCLLHEKNEIWVLYSDVNHDLEYAYLLLDKMQDALAASENRANAIQAELKASKFKVEGEISLRASIPHDSGFAVP